MDTETEATPQPTRDDEDRFSPWELLVGLFIGSVIGAIGRLLDLILLLARPRLLGPYFRVWAAQLRRSPYVWPRSFEARRVTKLAGQTIWELMYGEILLVSAVYLFWRAGVRRGSRLLDVGAGRGRALLAARWLGAEARGIEILKENVEATRSAIARAGATLELGNAAESDPSDATHVFLNWCGWRPETRKRIEARLALCKAGTRFIAVVRPIEGVPVAAVRTERVLFSWGTEKVHVCEVR